MKVNSLGSFYNQINQQKEKNQVVFNMKDFILTEDEKMKEKNGQLEVRKENGYIRQYIVRSDGSRKLISEMKETEVNTAKLNQKAEIAKSNKEQSNASQLMQLLNYTVGNYNNFASSYKVNKATTK